MPEEPLWAEEPFAGEEFVIGSVTHPMATIFDLQIEKPRPT